MRVTGLLIVSVTGSTEQVILQFCSGNGGVSELSSWLAFLLGEEFVVSAVLVCCPFGWDLLDWMVSRPQVESISAIFAAINFKYVAERCYTVYNTSGFPVCLLRMGFDYYRYRLSTDHRRQRFRTAVTISLGNSSFTVRYSSGWYMDALRGRKDLILRDMTRWTRELPCEGVGEFLHSKIAFHTSLSPLLPLVIIFTDDSAFPFDFR